MSTTGLHPRSGTGSITSTVVPLLPPTPGSSASARPAAPVLPSAPAPPVFVVRPWPAHAPALRDLIERCSTETLYRRFHGVPGRRVVDAELDRVAHPGPAHRSRLAVAGGQVVGIGTLAVGADGTAEVALLVEDGWQGHGVGHLLLDAVLDLAARHGHRSVHALVLGDNGAARRFFLTAAPGARATFADGIIDVVLPVAASQRHAVAS